ncbi:MAG: hypothetical protein IPJ00_10435 [Saprospirales bacterium]|nr:hypothetical protein [Saprospirales bacterium]
MHSIEPEAPMNSENFSSFLKDPSKLYQIPYQELKSLVVQYPYCQPLRVLLLQKSQMERHPDFEKNLHAAATYLPDRTLLYFLIREFQSLESGELLFELEEERLELKALSEILAVRDHIEPEIAVAVQAPAQETVAVAVEDLFKVEEDMEEGIEEGIVGGLEGIEGGIEMGLEGIEEEVMEEKVIPIRAPQPKAAFASWQKRYDHMRLAISINALEIPPAPRKEEIVSKSGGKPKLAQDLAKKSLQEKGDLVSETLAELLARQGHVQKAISMYEKLGLIFPEKSSFFASQIEKLKHK